MSNARAILCSVCLSLLLLPTLASGFGTTTNGQVRAMIQQPDGKIIVAGTFTAVIFDDSSVAFRNRIVRLNEDGSLDSDFSIGDGADGGIYALALTPAGKILIGGDFDNYDGVARNSIAQLNADGSLDTGFATGSGINGFVLALALQTDGGILVGGSFDTVRANPLNNLARFNSDSSVDQDFDIGTGTNGVVRSIALQDDGDIVIGGDFTRVDTSPRNYVALMTNTGLLRANFGQINTPNMPVNAVAVQPDGRIVIAGAFTQVAQFTRNRIARYTDTGLLDTAFTAGSGANNTIWAMAVQANGRILIGGDFTVLRGSQRIRIARINSDGSTDLSFNPGNGADDLVLTLLPQSNGKVLLGGLFANVRDQNLPALARLRSNGQLDTGQIDESVLCVPLSNQQGKVAVICL